MKTKVGKRYRITAYIENQMYKRFIEYKEETGFSESAIINLALYMFFSRGLHKNIQESLLREFDRNTEGDKENLIEERLVEKSFSTERFTEREGFTEIFTNKEKSKNEEDFPNKKEYRVFSEISKEEHKTSSDIPEEKPNTKEFKFFFELDGS